MDEYIVINSVSLNPSTVNTGGQFVISVEIFILYPSNNLYPSEDLYPTSDNGAKKQETYQLYPDSSAYPADGLYPKP